jgi:PTH2 family peptidyl-tRNA hydrolase
MSRPTKQVIVIRRDLAMRRGKEIAQGSHASMSFLTRRMPAEKRNPTDNSHVVVLRAVEAEWMDGSFAKVCLQVPGEAELLDVYERAMAAGLEVHLITDSGRTEFGGVPTRTCLAIGPDDSDAIDKVTGDLKLY